MRLRTQLVPLGRGRTSVDYFNGGEVSHDAMAAHALLQAMGEWWKESEAYDAFPAHSAVIWLEWRADKILAGWLGEEAG